jgi:hypothetical protein
MYVHGTQGRASSEQPAYPHTLENGGLRRVPVLCQRQKSSLFFLSRLGVYRFFSVLAYIRSRQYISQDGEEAHKKQALHNACFCHRLGEMRDDVVYSPE